MLDFAIPIFIMVCVSITCVTGAACLTPGRKRRLGLAFASVTVMSTVGMVLVVAFA